jgi:hypothetical protein
MDNIFNGERIVAQLWHYRVIAWVFVCFEMPYTGVLPCNVFQWRILMKRLGIRKWRLLPPSALPTPYIRKGVLYLPRVKWRDDLLLRYLAHEAAEAALNWEGVPPYLYVSNRDEREYICCSVEEIVYRCWVDPQLASRLLAEGLG